MKSVVKKLSQPIYIFLIILVSFGISAIGKAAQKLKRIVRIKREFLKSSQSAHLASRPWGYFHPSWEAAESADLPEAIAEHANLVEDPDGRMEREFKVPSSMRDRTAFWIAVYSRFTTHFRIVHDRDNPAMIYGYIDLRQIYAAYPNPRMAASKAHQIEKKIIQELKVRLAEAMVPVDAKTARLSPEEREGFQNLMAKFDSKDPAQVFARIRRIRTQTGQRDMFAKALKRSQTMLPQIEAVFREAGLPITLARLPFVESSFNRNALSKTGAMGIWQFMPDTARMFDRNGTRRDWSDPARQSKSAVKLFKIIHKMLPDWGLAVTSYNSGPARLVRLSKKFGTDSLEKLIEVPSARDTLGFAGKNFYTELLAATVVEAYKERLFPGVSLQDTEIAAVPKAKK